MFISCNKSYDDSVKLKGTELDPFRLLQQYDKSITLNVTWL